MKKLLLLLALGGFAVAGHAQEILVGADFKMYFDNKEFGSNEFAVPGLDIESGTDFAARLLPRVGIRWDEKNTLVIAADMIKNFGSAESAYLSEVKPVFYYQFRTPRVTAVAGIFTRDMMHDDDYSTAFFSGIVPFLPQPHERCLAQYNGQGAPTWSSSLRLGGHVFDPLARKVPASCSPDATISTAFTTDSTTRCSTSRDSRTRQSKTSWTCNC